MSIRISPKHGLNPTLPICFFCGKERGELALLGHIGGKKDEKAPMRAIIDYEPCDECQKLMKRGITLIGVTEKPIIESQPPIQEGLYPTGAFTVVKAESLEYLINDEELRAKTLECGKAFIEQKMLNELCADKSNTDCEEGGNRNAE